MTKLLALSTQPSRWPQSGQFERRKNFTKKGLSRWFARPQEGGQFHRKSDFGNASFYRSQKANPPEADKSSRGG
jgi:hypothetical protein